LDGQAKEPTLLARRVGESSGATSYHLRQLAAYGFAEDDPDRGGAVRERWWRATDAYTTWRDSDFIYDPELRGVLDGWLRDVLRRQLDSLDTWLRCRRNWPLGSTQSVNNIYQLCHDGEMACPNAVTGIVVSNFPDFVIK
jgi:hypothetical protein